jgi:hypothetical protein
VRLYETLVRQILQSPLIFCGLWLQNFTGITDMGGGYLAWKESGLPSVHEKNTPSHSV